MKTASVHELQRELSDNTSKQLIAYCMRLCKYKKENKELLTYLLFEAGDEKSFIEKAKEEIELQFKEMNQSNLYLVKKSIRKILRYVNKLIKFSGITETEAALRIHFVSQIKNSAIPFQSSTALLNLYTRQLEKIEKAILKMHEDLQFDFIVTLEKQGFKLFA